MNKYFRYFKSKKKFTSIDSINLDIADDNVKKVKLKNLFNFSH